MKTISLLLCACSFCLVSYGQTHISIALDESMISHFKAQDSLATVNAIMNEYWDTEVYNPYKEVKQSLPFHISFKDRLFHSPIPRKTVVTSRYGWRHRRPHKGIDLDLITGDPVMSMLDGKVRYVGYHPGHGKTVVVRHYNGLETAYAHLSSYSVAANDTVSKGQMLGQGGATGNARGSHLHLELMYRGIHIHP